MQQHAQLMQLTTQLKDFQKSFNSTWNWKGNRNLLNDALDKYIKQSDEYKSQDRCRQAEDIISLSWDNNFVEK